jgi:hypothetical protein
VVDKCKVDLSLNHLINRQGEAIPFVDPYDIGANDVPLRDDLLADIERQQLFELQIADDVLLTLLVDENFTEVEFTEVVEQFRSEFRLQIEQEDIALGSQQVISLVGAQLS